MQVTEHPFQAFIDLITLDQEIAVLEQSLLTIDHEIAALIAQENSEKSHLETYKKKAHEARKVVDTQELDLQSLDAQEKQKKERLENVTDHKQYQSIKNEIDALKLRQHKQEDALMQAWNALEAAQKEYAAVAKEQPEKIASLQSRIEEKNNAIATMEEHLEQKNSLRPAKEQLVPAEWLEKYAVMKARVADPVVPVQRGACSACFSLLPEQDLLLVRRRKLLQCKSCFRLLYSQELDKEGATHS